MKCKQTVSALFFLCALQACSSIQGNLSLETEYRTHVQHSADKSIGDALTIDGERHLVISTYFSALGQRCAITVSDVNAQGIDMTMAENSSVLKAQLLARFCFHPEQQSFIRLKPLIQE